MGALTSKVYSYKSRVWELDKRFTYTKDFEAILVYVRFNKILRIKSYDTNEWQKDNIQNFQKTWSNVPTTKIEYISNRVLKTKQRDIMNILAEIPNSHIVFDKTANIDFLEMLKAIQEAKINNEFKDNPNILLFKHLLTLNTSFFNIAFVVELENEPNTIIPGKGYFNEHINRIDADGNVYNILPALEKVQMSTQGGLNYIALYNDVIVYSDFDYDQSGE